MIKKYGKEIDMRKVNRNLENIKQTINNTRRRIDMYGNIETKRDHCPMCGCNKATPFFKVYDKFEYLQCEGCKGLYLINYPNIRTMYSNNDMNALTVEYIDESIFNERVNMISKPKVEFVLDVCRNESLSLKSWLDIGCGGGEIPYYLKKEVGIEAAGLETNPMEVEFVRNHGITVYEKYIDLDEEDTETSKIMGQYDCVSSIMMLEHVEEPEHLIDYYHHHMKENAILVIDVPKHPSLASFANMTSKDNIYRHITPPVHLQIFTIESIEHMFLNKFQILATWEFGQGFNDLLNNAIILSSQNETPLYSELQSCSNKVQKAIDECGYGDEIFVVAKRI